MARSGSESEAESKEPPPRLGRASVRVSVHALAKTGQGVGTLGGKEVFVRGALPGETVDARVEHRRSNGTIFADLDALYTKSPARIPIDCRHFGRCGGCDFLHATLDLQHAFKRGQVEQALGLPACEVIPSPKSYRYRTFAKFVIAEDGTLGSYRPKTHDVVDMSGCLIHCPEIELVAELVRSHFASHPPKNLRYLLMRFSPSIGRVSTTLVMRKPHPLPDTLLALLRGCPSIFHIGLHENDTPGDALLVSEDIRTVFHDDAVQETTVAPEAFAQVNPWGAERLYLEAIAILEPSGQRVLDLYAGAGATTERLLASGATRVVAVERTKAAVAAGRAQVQGATWIEGSVEAELPRIRMLGPFDRILMNPPRRGLSQAALFGIAELKSPRLVYVSCNPETLGRDLTDLQSMGYSPFRIVPVDMFPQTRHIETVAGFVRSDT